MSSADVPRLTILVVDNDALAAQVDQLGYQAVCVAGDRAALDAMRDQPPDLMLVGLPDALAAPMPMVGLLRQAWPERWIPVIATAVLPAGGAGGAAMIRALDGQADDFLPQPLDPALWRARLEHYRRLLAGQRRLVSDLSERQRADRMKDEFLATVSHELRTPLTSVIGALGLLAAGVAGELPAASAPLMDAARRNGERLSRLIDDILDLTKLEGDRIEFQMRDLPLGQLLREALAANQGYADRAGVSLQLLADGDGPLVRLAADRMLQVLANLIPNAIKHSPAGAMVTLGLQVAAQRVRVRVSDRGPGIDPAFRSRMFEKFAQADGSDRRAHGGTGLGLYLTRMLVQRMDGHIDVEQQAGQGACFVVEFAVAGGVG
jgi:signal transduction histidine kinase